jgi:hypothetical protein
MEKVIGEIEIVKDHQLALEEHYVSGLSEEEIKALRWENRNDPLLD